MQNSTGEMLQPCIAEACSLLPINSLLCSQTLKGLGVCVWTFSIWLLCPKAWSCLLKRSCVTEQQMAAANTFSWLVLPEATQWHIFSIDNMIKILDQTEPMRGRVSIIALSKKKEVSDIWGLSCADVWQTALALWNEKFIISAQLIYNLYD